MNLARTLSTLVDSGVVGDLLERDLSFWNTLFVDYELPTVERLWCTLPDRSDHRFFIHRVHPCERALYHAHPWPSAVMILHGRYEMRIGYGLGPNGHPRPVAATVILGPGDVYEMADVGGWHSVRPIDHPVLSYMLTGPRWERHDAPRPKKELRALTEEEALGLLNEARANIRGGGRTSPFRGTFPNLEQNEKRGI